MVLRVSGAKIELEMAVVISMAIQMDIGLSFDYEFNNF